MNVSWYYPVYQASKGDKEGEKKRERELGKEGRDMPLTLFPPPLPPPPLHLRLPGRLLDI